MFAVMAQEWFETWFDSKYYDILYSNRDEQEAAGFLSRLLDFLNPERNALFLDLACGRGRHSIHLNKLGYKVDGADYSESKINVAAKHENKNLHFFIHDMRDPLPVEKYDYILNLFTSFGYFDTHEEHECTLNHVHKALKPEGRFVLDFLNPGIVVQKLIPDEHVMLNGIDFFIIRELKSGMISKRIKVVDGTETHHYEENVRAFTNSELRFLLEQSGFKISAIFGDYNLKPFDEKLSERQLFIAEK